METQLGAHLHPLIAGRILLKQASLSEHQQQVLALKTNVLMEYDEVVRTLRPLDRLDTLARAGAISGAGGTNRAYLQAGEDEAEGGDYEEDFEEETEASNSEEDEDFLQFEDKEYDEAEAIYVQAYNDVRKDLRSRRKERGFVKHGRKANGGSPRKGRGKGCKGDCKRSPTKQKKDEFIRGTEGELLARTRCFSCQELGHVSRNCPNKAAASSPSPKKTFVAVTPSGQSTTTSYAMFRQDMGVNYPPKLETLVRATYAGVTVRGFEAVLDTAAEQCLIGSTAMHNLKEELKLLKLRPIPVRQQATPCAGIGGRAQLAGVVDVPTCVAGLLGVVRFTIIEDSATFVTPPLLGVSYLEAVGAVIDLQSDTYNTPDGHSTAMRRLPSGHRAVHLLDFGVTPWKLPQQHQVNGHDPFRIPVPRSSHYFSGGNGDAGFGDTMVSCEADAGWPMDDAFFAAYVESKVLPLDTTATSAASANVTNREERSRSPSRAHASERSATVAYTEGTTETSERRAEREPMEEPSQAATSDGGDLPPEDPHQAGLHHAGALQADPSGGEELLAEEPQPDDQPALEGDGHPLDRSRLPTILPVIRENAESEVRGEGDGTDSPVTDPSISPSQTTDDLTVTSYLGQNLDPNKVIDVFVEMKDSSKLHLARYEGWRFKLFDPFDIPQARRLQLTDRRQVVARFPHEETRVLIDKWPVNINRFLEHPWHGTVTFFESRGPPQPFNAFGIVPKRGPRPPPRDPQPPQDPPPGWSGPSSSSTGDTSLGPTAADFRQRSGGSSEDVQAKVMRQPAEFSLDCTDDDGRWNEIIEMDAGDCDEDVPDRHHVDRVELGVDQKAGRVFKLGMLKNCMRRKRTSNSRSPFAQFMIWTLSGAAQTFLDRIQRRHGAQEEDQRSGQQPSSLGLCHGGQGGPGGRAQEEDGKPQVLCGMVARRDGAAAAPADHATADGLGLLAEEGSRAGRPGARERWGKEEEVDPGEAQGDEDGMDSAGNRTAPEALHNPEVLGQGTRGVQPPGRVSTLSCKSRPAVVDMPDMRISMGTTGRRSDGIVYDNTGSRDTGVREALDKDRCLSTVPASSKVQAGAGSSEVEGGPHGDDLNRLWSSWIQSRTNSKNQHTKASGNSQRAVTFQGTSGGRSSSLPVAKEDPNLPPGSREPRCSGAGGGSTIRGGLHGRERQRADGSGLQRSGRILADKSQLGGRNGKALASLVASRFSKFMAFLCMNCCLPPSAVSAFGTPDLVAMHHGNEFKIQHGFTEPEFDQQAEDFVGCYIYGQMSRHFVNSSADGFGKVRPLSKENQKWLTKNLKSQPTIVEVYSPPRVTEKAKQYGFTPGGALDLTTGWDFRKKSHQQAALRLIRDQQPVLVILSPPCTTFSPLRFLSNHKRNPEVVAEEEDEELEHVRFSGLIAKIQHRGGRGFLFEHPRGATSWKTSELQELRELPGVFAVQVDLCRFGLKTTKGHPALKPTLLLTNVEELANILNRRCEGYHAKHQPLLSGEAKHAAKYTPAFVDAILRGLRRHVQAWVKSNNPAADYWEITDTLVTRHHRVPRRALFVPTGVAGCPQDVANISSARTTTMKTLKGPVQTIQDNWRTTAMPCQSMKFEWTGTTSFPVQESILLPNDWKAVANYIVQAAAHPIHHYITEETAVQVEWSAFPSHKTLGGAPSSSAVGTSGPSTFNRFSGQEDEDVDAEMMGEDLDIPANPEEPEETSETKVKHALRPLQLSKPATDNVLHPEVRRELFKIHRNLGHPSLQLFVRALKHAGVKPEILQWVKHHFHCPLCERRQRPSLHRPGRLHKAMGFNEVVGVDLMQINVEGIGEYLLLNCLCWGTDMQIVEPIADKQADTVYRAFAKEWMAHYGPPALVVADQGREFVGNGFTDPLGHLGVPVHFINVRSPWENGRTERAGGILKSRLETTLHEIGATTDEEVKAAISEVTVAHNRYYNRSGFTPYQRAFGTLPRMPASLLSDDAIDKQLILDAAGDSMKRAWKIREEATKAWLRWQDDESVRRAVSTRTRTADNKSFDVGELVYIWRSVPGYKGWTGPGTIVAQKDDTVWVSMRGYLIKASKGQTRKATSEESLGAELVRHLSAQMLEDLESNAVKFYRDVEGEGAPEGIGNGEDDGYSPSLAPEEEEPFSGGDSPLGAEPSILQPIPEEPDAPMEEVQQPMDGVIMDNQSERSTVEPAVTPTLTEDTSQARSRSTSQTFPDRRLSGVRVDEGSGGTLGFGPIRDGPPVATPAMPYPSPPQGLPSWPRPTHSLYFEVSSDPAAATPRWTLDRPTGKYTMNPPTTSKFNINEAGAVYNYSDKCMYLTKTKAKTSPGQVEFRKLSEKHKNIFRQARAKEVKSLLDSGAIKILSLAESKQFLREHPNHVLTSRYVDRWKPTDAFGVLPEEYGHEGFQPEDHGGLAPKSRWCVVGWKDPHIHQIERAAPTPMTSSMYLALQLSASRKWVAFGKDAKTAFLQSRPTTRVQKLACRMPTDEQFQGYHMDQLILLLTEVYGLVSGPAWWRRSLLEILVKELGYRVNVYDRCVLTLDGDLDPQNPDKEVPTLGYIVLEVDDLLESGGPAHRARMDKLEGRLKFGKVVNLMESEGGSGYAGRRIKQHPDFSFTYSMDDYVTNRLQPVKVHRRILKKNAAETLLNEDEISQLRGTIAAINWSAREGRPDGSASASILSGCFPEPNMKHLLDCNQVVELLKGQKITIKIHHIPEKDIRHLLIADSSFDPSGKTKPQHGWIQGITTPALNRGEEAPVSLISWRSKKIRRKAGSTTLCESISLSTALAAMEKQMATFTSFRFSRFDPRSLARDIEVEMGLRGPPTVIAAEDPKFVDPETIAIIDAKSVFDSTSSAERQFQGEDDRAALEAAIIQESLANLRARLRWIPHNVNPSDGLTKLPQQAHMQPLYDLLKRHSMKIQREEIELASGRQGDKRLKVHGAVERDNASLVHKTLGG